MFEPHRSRGQASHPISPQRPVDWRDRLVKARERFIGQQRLDPDGEAPAREMREVLQEAHAAACTDMIVPRERQNACHWKRMQVQKGRGIPVVLQKPALGNGPDGRLRGAVVEN